MLDTASLSDTDWDWSEESGSLEYLRQRRKRCMKETVLFSFLQSVSHLAMLSPLLYTGTALNHSSGEMGLLFSLLILFFENSFTLGKIHAMLSKLHFWWFEA
jgi:hypothetical protein